ATPLALRLREYALRITSQRITFLAAFLLCGGLSIWLTGPQAAQLYKQESIPLVTLKPGIAFIESHYPNARILNHVTLGGVLIYEGATVAPFADGRMETVYRRQLLHDYFQFEYGFEGWEAVLETYAIDGVLLSNNPVYSALI